FQDRTWTVVKERHHEDSSMGRCVVFGYTLLGKVLRGLSLGKERKRLGRPDRHWRMVPIRPKCCQLRRGWYTIRPESLWCRSFLLRFRLMMLIISRS
ncbi:hypothetical protein IGI04_002419, partial [Brassica rapa subsp. trilocularis]